MHLGAQDNACLQRSLELNILPAGSGSCVNKNIKQIFHHFEKSELREAVHFETGTLNVSQVTLITTMSKTHAIYVLLTLSHKFLPI